MAKPAPTATETNLEQEAEAELPPLSPKEEAWLEHTATPEQLQFFSDNGFLVVENACDSTNADCAWALLLTICAVEPGSRATCSSA
eukprot:COSAG04_NODE_199_length_20482_cov_32.401559_5_plen_86_part_00